MARPKLAFAQPASLVIGSSLEADLQHYPSSHLPEQVDRAAAIRILSRPTCVAPSGSIVTRFAEVVARFSQKIALDGPAGTVTYAELDHRSERIARGLIDRGVRRGEIVAFRDLTRADAIVTLLGIMRSGAAYLPIEPGTPNSRVEYMLQAARVRHVLTGPIDGIGSLPTITGADRAYLLFTSGSTGVPKGVAVPHRGIMRLVVDADFVAFGPERTFLQTTPLSFDVSLFDIWGALLHGARVVLPDDGPIVPAALAAVMVAKRVETLWLTTALFNQMIDHYPTCFASVRQLVVGGEALSVPHVCKALKALPADAIFVNGYGPTENSVLSCCYRVPRDFPPESPRVPIGFPLRGTFAEVWDADGQVLPDGEVGELVVGGAGVAEGYWNDPTLTAERFPEGMYRTGDRVRKRPDGTYDYLGRLDSQVKLRGHRIELGEVESALLALPGVSGAAAVVRPDATNEPQLLAYVVADATFPANARSLLAERLSTAAIPSAIVRLDRLPTNLNGKIDRSALPAPNFDTGPPPATDTERTVARLWSEVLGVPALGREADFLALGGHSLKVMDMLDRVRQSLGVVVSPAELFAHPTLRTFAERCIQPADVLVPTPRLTTVPLTPTQERMRIASLMHPDRTPYNEAIVLRFEGPLDAGRLEAAFRQVVADEELFRSAVAMHSDVAVWVPARKPVPFDRRPAVREDVSTPFDLNAGPLVRGVLTSEGANTHRLLIVMHHLVCDGKSFGLLGQRLAQFYAGLPLDRSLRCFAEFAVAEHVAVRARPLELPATLELPADRPVPRVPTFAGVRVSIPISPDTEATLRRCARAERVTPFMFLATAFGTLLARDSEQEHFGIGIPLDARGSAYRDCIGCFVRMHTLTVDTTGNPTFRALLCRTREAVAHLLDPNVAEHTGPTTYRTAFSYNSPAASTDWPGLKVTQVRPETHTSRFDLTLFATDWPDAGWGLWFEASLDRYDRSSIDALVHRFTVLLDAIAENLDTAVGALSLGVPRAVPCVAVPAGSIVSRFAEVVSRHPNRVALDGFLQIVTYAELDQRSERIARGLVDRGVVPGEVVAFRYLSRVDAVTTMLGILRAGAAYLPIDKDLPERRVQQMLADAEVNHVLTETIDGTGSLPTVTGDHRAYVLFTSGSTGVPKGVVVPHRAVVRLVIDTDYIAFGPERTFLQAAPLGFDAATFEIWGALLHGARLVLPMEGRVDPALLAETIVAKEVETLWLTAALFHHMVETYPMCFGRVKQLLAGGEALSVPHVRKALTVLPTDAVLVNGYGPTENTVFSCCYRVPRDVPAETMRVPIGVPIPGTFAEVRDRFGNPTPDGLPGELYVGGAGVAEGYLGDPLLTAEKFVNGMYRTGDRVRKLPEGTFDFLGRTDRQVKIRGIRIEPDEVEATVRALPGVTEAAVVVREDVPDEKRLVAYCVGVRRDFRNELAERLPAALVPVVVSLDALPRTPQGKLDRAALPAPEAIGEKVPPKNQLERELVAIWADVLGVPEVGVTDDFFALGGHSLSAAKVVEKASQVTGLAFELADFYRTPTVAALAGRERALLGVQRNEQWTLLRPGDGKATVLWIGPADELAVLRKCLPESLGLGWLRPDALYAPPYRIRPVPVVAQDYLQALEKAPPVGKWLVCGFSFQGLVAYEVIRLLRTAGRTVEGLLLEPPVPYMMELSAQSTTEPIDARIDRHRVQLRPLRLGGRLRYLGSRSLRLVRKTVHAWSYRRWWDLRTFLGMPPSRTLHYWYWMPKIRKLVKAYEPPTCPGNLTVVGRPEWFRQFAATWHARTQGTCREISIPDAEQHSEIMAWSAAKQWQEVLTAWAE